MNNAPQPLIFIGGFYTLAFALFHLMFWKIFRWKEDLKSLTFTNRGVMQILNFCLTFVFFVVAYLSFFHSAELIETNLGRTILAAISLFWFLRMIEQVLFFGIKARLSLGFTITFLVGSLIYLVPLL